MLDPNESPEEKHERITRILEKNSKTVTICISCREQITNNQTLVESIHGPYHGWPLNCVDGRDDFDD